LYALRYYPHTQTYKLILELSLRWKVALAGLAAFLSFWAMQGYFNALGTIFLHPEQRLAIALTFQWNTLNWFGFVMFVALSVLYFFVSHSLARLFIQFGTDNKQKDLVILLIAGVLFTGITYWFKIFAPWLLLLNGLYFSALYVLKLPKLLPRLQYSTSIYFFLSAVICALVSTYAIYSFGAKKSLKEKKAFATRLLPENDAIAETQLGEAIPIIQKDTLLLKLFADSTQSTEQARQWIRRAYLGNYFHKYEVRIHFFEAMVGKEIGAENTDTLTYNDFTEKYKKIWYDTPNSAIRFIDQGVNIVKRYVVFVKMNEGEQELGNIVLDLRQRAGSEGKVYPELLVNQNFIPSPLTKHYSYAVYDDDLPAYQVGKFNFEKDFNTRWFEQDDLFLSSWVHNGMEHLAVSGGFNKKVVVASPSYAFYDIYANFSFFFLLLILFIVMILVIYSIRHRISRLKPNFATRIQIYLNIAFFLPLFTVSWITWSVIGTTYKQDLENNFIQQTEGVARNLQEHLENYQNHKITKENLTQQLNQIAQNVEVDINVFDQNGYLITSSQSAIYENDGLISKYLNPMAWRELVQNKNQKVLLRESVGKLSFQTAYIPLKTYIKERRRQLLGVVGVPFFDAQNELDRKRMEILSLIINIFASVFMAFVIFSYFASQMLTVPLRLITAQIRKTTFNNYSEPLVWNSQDEIGLFVQEYNKMLRKLDRSKDELAQIQRENAWREIAQQVAHEIKNPLTPMKLSIQMMQVRLQNQSENVRMMFERSIDTLLTQIDILSDIATSFSSFAKMPIPVSERFEITEVLRDTQNLYSNEEVELIFDIAPGKFFIRGDRKLLGRIFTNLIKNALEAMPEDRPAQIIVRLTQEVEGLVLVEFKDNGAGVPADVQDKIFMPNFTTKSSGSGIGLAVAKRGIDHAGGRIWFETEDDKGTSFFIELPLVE
jgi:nitrogen fixation/metabolism regulation signal transduction histidine kinase